MGLAFHEKFMGDLEIRQFLKSLKGLPKDQPYVNLVYMTGELPIAKYSSGSELNMFLENNFMNDCVCENFFGLMEDEVKELCSIIGMTVIRHIMEKYQHVLSRNSMVGIKEIVDRSCEVMEAILIKSKKRCFYFRICA